LEPVDERLTILLIMEGFFSEKKREMYGCKRNEKIRKIFPLLITNQSQVKRYDIYEE